MNSIDAYWHQFVRSRIPRDEPAPTLYGTITIGSTRDSADLGARLIVSGLKTATVSLAADYMQSNKAPPFVGALSVVLDGSGEPVAIVETTETVECVLREVDADFARDYAEWDGTLETWRHEIMKYYQIVETALLLCERFKVVWR